MRLELDGTEQQENDWGTVNETYDETGVREPSIVTGNNTGTQFDAQYYSNAGFSSLSDMENGLKNEYKEMATSVAKYKGFYIGRYESSLTTATESTAGNGGTIQSKRGVLPTAANNSATNMWYGLYKIQKEYSSTEMLLNSNVNSSMIWGSQWDEMLHWIEKGNDSNRIQLKTICNGGNTLNTTGNKNYDIDRLNNIYDLNGNLFEATMTARNPQNRILRGGSYFYNEYRYTAKFIGVVTASSNASSVSSRLTLYLK